MQRQKIILIIGIVLSVVAGVATKLYLDRQRAMIVAEGKKKAEELKASITSVMVAKKDIPVGINIDPNSLEVQMVPKNLVRPQAVTSLSRIEGMITIAPIAKGDQITLASLKWSQQAVDKTGGAGGSLSSAMPVGKRAITISFDNVSSLIGMIRPKDYVDIISTMNIPFTTPEGQKVSQTAVIPLLQNVMVLAVGKQVGASEGDDRYKKTSETKDLSGAPITLALTPQETNILAFVQEHGKLRLVLRAQADAEKQVISPITWESLFQYILPQKPGQEQKPATVEQQPQYVEVYRGLNREVIPLTTSTTSINK